MGICQQQLKQAASASSLAAAAKAADNKTASFAPRY
jgi:hypothetical protein